MLEAALLVVVLVDAASCCWWWHHAACWMLQQLPAELSASKFHLAAIAQPEALIAKHFVQKQTYALHTQA